MNTTTTAATTVPQSVRRRRADPGTLSAADIIPQYADPPDNTSLMANSGPKPSTPTGPIKPSVTEKDCSSFNSVKSYYLDKWTTYKNMTNVTRKVLIDSQYIRTEIFDKALSESKLAAFSKEDVDCIRNRKENLTANCLFNILTVDVKKENIHIRIENMMAKFKSIKVNQNSCARSKEVGDCVKKVLTGCNTTVLNLVGDLESVTSQECKKTKESLPRINKMSTTINVVIALACICSTAAVALGVMKYWKMRRNSAVHTVTKPEEHEMSSTAKSVN